MRALATLGGIEGNEEFGGGVAGIFPGSGCGYGGWRMDDRRIHEGWHQRQQRTIQGEI